MSESPPRKEAAPQPDTEETSPSANAVADSRHRAGTSPSPDADAKPDSPAKLRKDSWLFALKSAVRQFSNDQASDLAAALTYFALLSLFPALIAVISLLGVVGNADSTTQTMLHIIDQVAPGGIADRARGIIESLTTSRGSGIALVIGIAAALWSASRYVGAFSRAMNRIYQIDEGRPGWKLKPQMLLLTFVLVLTAALVLTSLALSGPVARAVGGVIGLGDTAVRVWGIAKWPAVLAVVVIMVALLYYFTPNIQQPKFRWISLGSATAIIVWVLASALFGLYVANFGSYDKTYGAMASVIVLLLWVWITNIALLLGAEIDSELERARELQAGIKAEDVLRLPPRDTAQTVKAAQKQAELHAEATRIRQQAIGAPHSTRPGKAPKDVELDQDGFVVEDD